MLKPKEAQRRAQFEALLLPYLESLYGTAVRMTKNPAEAEDLIQDTCLKAFRFLDRYQPGTNFKAWIFKIMTNVFINKYHKNQRGREVYQEIESDGHYSHVLAQGSTRAATQLEESILDHLMSEDIQECLAELPPDFRMAVMLSDVEEFSYKEIAEIMDCPVGTVMSRLYRARRLLQKQLVQHALDRGFRSAEQVEVGSPPADAGPQAEGAEVCDLATYRQQKRREQP